MSEFYIVSVAHTNREHSYITVWRPDNCGYAWPLSWAGKYSEAEVKALPDYYHNGTDSFAVPCGVLDEIAVPTVLGTVDNNAGPVVMNNRANWQRILQAIPWPTAKPPMPQHKGARRAPSQRGEPCAA